MSRQTTAQLKNEAGSEITFTDSHSDAPIIPFNGLAKLHSFRPDRVDWVLEQTQIEAEARRREENRVHTFIFVERVIGILSAMAIGLGGIGGGLYAAMHGHDWVGGTIATVTIGTLAVAFLRKPPEQ